MWISFRNKFSLSLRNSHQKIPKVYPVNDGNLPLRSTLRFRTKVRAKLCKTWQNLGHLHRGGACRLVKPFLSFYLYLPKISQNAIDITAPRVLEARKLVLGRHFQLWERFTYSYSSLPKYVLIRSCINEKCRKKNIIGKLSALSLYQYTLPCLQVRVTFRGRWSSLIKLKGNYSKSPEI